MKKFVTYIALVSFGVTLLALAPSLSETIYMTKTAWVKFSSDAPLELINAENSNVSAVLNTEKKTLAFKVPIVSFQGFNSALQHEHFNENYMEHNLFPSATFNGKIIEDIDFTTPGKHTVRAKGILSIHGVEKERIVSGKIEVSQDLIIISTNFEVPLSDHDIIIPKIVNQKIAEVIEVELKANLKP